MPIDYDAIVAALTSDRDCYALPDGRYLRLRIQPDDDYNPFDEVDCYGRVSHVDNHRDRTTGWTLRPDGFDGNAEKVWAMHDNYWWQPPADGPRRGTDEFRKLRQLVCDLIAFGGQVVTVELLRGTDAYGRSIVRDVASLGGIDSLADGYLAEVVSDLIGQIDLTSDLDVADGQMAHDWQTSAWTRTTTCARCGLLPLDADDIASECVADGQVAA